MTRTRQHLVPHDVRRLAISVLADLLFEEGALGIVGGQGERLPVGIGCLAGAAEPAEQVGLDRGQVVVAGEAPVRFEPLDFRERRLGPETIASGTARFSATTGDGHTSSSLSYTARICGQSVWSYEGAWA